MNVTASQAKNTLPQLLERTRVAGECVVIEKHGKAAGALVSMDDLRRLERLDGLERAALHRPLLGTVRKYSDPFEPTVAEGDWDSHR